MGERVDYIIDGKSMLRSNHQGSPIAAIRGESVTILGSSEVFQQYSPLKSVQNKAASRGRCLDAKLECSTRC
jgi:hypothetical protein